MGSWEDVPQAVEQLARKQGKDPLPDGELCFFVHTDQCVCARARVCVCVCVCVCACVCVCVCILTLHTHVYTYRC